MSESDSATIPELEHYEIAVTPGYLRCGHQGCPASDVQSLTVQKRASNAWRGQILVVFGLVVMPLILYMPCITGVTLLSVIVGGALWLAAEPAGYALVLRTRRGTVVQLARHQHAHTIYRLHAHLVKTLGLSAAASNTPVHHARPPRSLGLADDR